MAESLDVRVLGDFCVLRDSEPVELPPSKKTRALLAYLAVTEQPHQRERLCELFWDVPDDPRGALRWSLSKIRRIVCPNNEPHLVADRNTVAINLRRGVDYHRISHLRRENLASRSTAELEEAAGLLRGTFLADLTLPRCPDYEAWRVAIANEIEIIQLRVLQELTQRLGDTPERALTYAHALQRALPDNADVTSIVLALEAKARQSAVAALLQPGVQHSRERSGDTAREADQYQPQQRVFSAPAAAEHQDTRFCRTRDGTQIAYAVSGKGPPILRAAHWMSHLQYDWESPMWRHWMRSLSEKNTLIRYDERCNGLSDWNVADVSFEAMLSDLESVVDATGLSRFTLLGVSQSCAVSVAYAVRHPELVSGLILYGGYVKGWRKRGNPREIATREALATLMREGWGQDSPLFRQLFTSLFIKQAGAEQIAWLDELQRRTVSPDNAWRLQNTFADIDVSELLPHVEVPTLVMHAHGDAVAPVEAGRAFAAGIPRARFIELDSANHILIEGEPAFAQFVEHIREFVLETAGRGVTSPAEQREQISVLAVEIISPLAAFEELDPGLFMRAVDPLLDIAVAAIEHRSGLVVSRGQSDLTAVFSGGGPIEDLTHRGARAALAVKKIVEGASDGAVRVRTALDCGEVIVRVGTGGGQRSFNGAPVRVARRLVQCLNQGVIAVTSRAQAALGTSNCMDVLDPSVCPSFSRDQLVYQLVGEVDT
jgi:pimeloyl-ACP methyl ester carboxylesterase/DNA-binding SARP family transcriptional activator